MVPAGRSRWRRALTTGTLALMTLLAAAPAAACSDSSDPGSVVSSTPLTAALPGRATRILYRSTDADGRPITVSGTVIVPARTVAGSAEADLLRRRHAGHGRPLRAVEPVPGRHRVRVRVRVDAAHPRLRGRRHRLPGSRHPRDAHLRQPGRRGPRRAGRRPGRAHAGPGRPRRRSGRPRRLLAGRWSVRGGGRARRVLRPGRGPHPGRRLRRRGTRRPRRRRCLPRRHPRRPGCSATRSTPSPPPTPSCGSRRGSPRRAGSSSSTPTGSASIRPPPATRACARRR